jgi:asparagine synthase (glutamine-hydrolysing)
MPDSFLFLSGNLDARELEAVAERLSRFAGLALQREALANGALLHAPATPRDPTRDFRLERAAPARPAFDPASRSPREPHAYLAGLCSHSTARSVAAPGSSAALRARLAGYRCAVLFDPRESRFTLARDRSGLRNLYYALDPAFGIRIAASNRLRWLLHGLPPGSFTLDPESVAQVLCTGFTVDPSTLLREVASLPAGWRLDVSERPGGDASLRADADPNLADVFDAERARAQVRAALIAATEDALRGSASPSCLLSGGVDSSCVASIAQRILGIPIATYSLVFGDESLSEARYATAVATRLGTRHHNVELSQRDFEAGLDSALSALDQPTSDALNTWFITRAIADAGADVALTGVGSDELFGGHDCNESVPRGLRALQALGWLPAPLRRAASRALEIMLCEGDSSRPSQALRGKQVALLREPIELGAVYLLSRRILLPRAVSRLLPALAPEQVGRLPEAIRAHIAALEARADGIRKRIAAHEQQLYLCGQLVRDLAMVGAATGVDLRLPFRDAQLIASVGRIAEATLYLPGRPKRFLIESFADVLPTEAYQRPKMGFVMPVHDWLGGAVQSRVDALTAQPEILACAGLDRGATRALLDDCRSARGRIFYTREWVLLVLLDWIGANRSALGAARG